MINVENIQWIIDVIDTVIRTKKTRAKIIEYIDLVVLFEAENNIITKPQLTKIKNTLDKLIGSVYGGKLAEIRGRNNYHILDELARHRGYDNYIMHYENRSLPHNVVANFNMYGLTSIKINVKNMQGVEFNEFEQAFINKYYPNMDKWLSLINKIEYIEKTLNPTKEQKEAKKLQEIKGRINPNLRTAIDTIAEDFRVIIEQGQIEYYNRTIKDFTTNYPDGFARKDIDNVRVKYVNILSFILQENRDTRIFTLVDNYKDVLKRTVYEYSINVIVQYQIKMYDKLGGIVVGDFSTKVYGVKQFHHIDFNFENGARFTLKNQIVHKVSHLGTFFYTYPTTFHDAYLPDGSKVMFPDEYTVKKAFNDIKATV